MTAVCRPLANRPVRAAGTPICHDSAQLFNLSRRGSVASQRRRDGEDLGPDNAPRSTSKPHRVPARFLAGSLFLHGLVFLWATPLLPAPPAERPPLQARLAMLSRPPLVTPMLPQPSSARRVRESALPKPHREARALAGTRLPSQVPLIARDAVSTDAMAVPAVATRVENSPAGTTAVPAAEPEPPSRMAAPPIVGAAERPLDTAALDAYARTLSVEVAKQRRYPAVARMRGWQGTAVLTISLSPAGMVLKSAVSRSSGYAVLDEQALKMVAESSPLPGAPSSLRGRVLEIELPVVFTLAAG